MILLYNLLLRARENRAKQILGWSMLLWAFLAAVRVSVNLYLEDSKEIFHPDVLIMGCIVVATLACYVIEVLRPCYMTVRRFFIFTSPIWVLGISFLIYRLSGGNIHRYNSFGNDFCQCRNENCKRSQDHPQTQRKHRNSNQQ